MAQQLQNLDIGFGSTTCNNDNYYFYHPDNFAGTDGTGVGFGKYDNHISINNYNMKNDWVGIIRTRNGFNLIIKSCN